MAVNICSTTCCGIILQPPLYFNVSIFIILSSDIRNFVLFRNLPHGLATDSQFVSLFVKDLDRKSREHEDTVFHYKELLSKHNIQEISEVSLARCFLKLTYLLSFPCHSVMSPFEIVRIVCWVILRLKISQVTMNEPNSSTTKNLKRKIEIYRKPQKSYTHSPSYDEIWYAVTY